MGRTGSCIGSFIGGAATGAGLMYILDPNRGRSRRVVLRDKAARGIRVLQRETNKQLRNAGNHLRGQIRELRSSVHDRASNIDDDILLDRVHAQLGREVRHMRMLDLHIENGRVIAEGPVLDGEAAKIRKRLLKTRGVRDCDVRVNEVSREEMERLSGSRGFSPQRVAM